MTVINAISSGKIKCNVKNRLRVGNEIANPPQISVTSLFPIIGIAENRFVITVAAQKDICPHGRIYPKNADAIDKISIIIPVFHTFKWIHDLKYNLRKICI
ncbi:MAG: hypothetical protein LN589_03025 [Rickettsia endosymbiont of Eriopis connexa]|nr:hypothetical protein [Rickettsia endosymbiont of Eriopis connexa]